MDAESTLQYCLEEIAAGRLTPRDCASLFPEYVGLEGELLAAQALQTLAAAVPSPAAQQAFRAQFLAQARGGRLRRAAQPGAGRPRAGFRLAWPSLRWASTAAAILVVLLLATAGTVSAAGNSLPGDWLYPLKRTTESIRVALTPASREADLHAEFAEERAEELLQLAQRGDYTVPAAETALAEAVAEVDTALAFISQAPAGEQAELLENVLLAMDRQQAVLETVRSQVPPQAQAGLNRALAAAQAQRARAQALLVDLQNGSTVPPGQTRVPPGQTNVPPGLTHIPPSQTRAAQGQTNVPPGQTRVPPGQTRVPPGQEKKTPSPTAPNDTPLEASATSAPTDVPPGQARKTASPMPEPTRTPRPNQGGNPESTPATVPNCASNPNSPNYCTPTAAAGGESEIPPPPVEPTACPTNPGGQPKCN